MKRREMMLSVRDLFDNSGEIWSLGFLVSMLDYNKEESVITSATIIPLKSKSISMLHNKLLSENFGIGEIEEIIIELDSYYEGGGILLIVCFAEEELILSSNEEPLVVNIFHEFLDYLDMASPHELLSKMGFCKRESDLDTDGE